MELHQRLVRFKAIILKVLVCCFIRKICFVKSSATSGEGTALVETVVSGWDSSKHGLSQLLSKRSVTASLVYLSRLSLF